MMQYLMQVPPEFWAKVLDGGAYVEGSLVKDSATKLILTHLQPTSQLTNALASVAGGPLVNITGVSSVIANAQLVQIKSLLETLQT